MALGAQDQTRQVSDGDPTEPPLSELAVAALRTGILPIPISSDGVLNLPLIDDTEIIPVPLLLFSRKSRGFVLNDESIPDNMYVNGLPLKEAQLPGFVGDDLRHAFSSAFLLSYITSTQEIRDFFICMVGGRPFRIEVTELENFTREVNSYFVRNDPEAVSLLPRLAVMMAATLKMKKLGQTIIESRIAKDGKLKEEQDALFRMGNIYRRRLAEIMMNEILDPNETIAQPPADKIERVNRLIEKKWLFTPQSAEGKPVTITIPRVDVDRELIVGFSPAAIDEHIGTKSGSIGIVLDDVILAEQKRVKVYCSVFVDSKGQINVGKRLDGLAIVERSIPNNPILSDPGEEVINNCILSLYRAENVADPIYLLVETTAKALKLRLVRQYES